MSKTWFITGTSSGFGLLLTRRLLAGGERVAATLRRPEVLDDLRAEYGDRLWVRRLDVTEPESVREVIDAAFAELGTIDVIVNNAGYAVFTAVEEASDEQIRKVVDTNLIGSIAVIRAALKHLRAQGHGRILQISTAGGQAAFPNFGFYHASKWGIEGFCETVAQEVAPFGIGVTIVEPGAAPTGFGAALDTAPIIPEYDVGPAGETRRAIADGSIPLVNDPEKIAAALVTLVESEAVPLRLPLGPDAYEAIRTALTSRLAEHESHRETALSVVLDEFANR